MFKYTLLISDEASGKVVERKINDFEKIFIVPKKKLKSEIEFSNQLRGRSITHIKINATLNSDEITMVMRNVTPSMMTAKDAAKQ